MRKVWMVVVLGLVAGCADKAKPDLLKCEQLESEKRYEEAVAACQRAKSADVQSEAGKMAAVKIPALQAAQKEAEAARLAAEQARKDELKKEIQGDIDEKTKRIEELRERLEDPEVRKAYQEQLEKAKQGAGK